MSKVSTCTCGQSDPQGATASRNDEGNHACFCMVKAICGSDTQGRIQEKKNSGTQLNSFFNLQLSRDFQFIINGEKIKGGAREVSIGFVGAERIRPYGYVIWTKRDYCCVRYVVPSPGTIDRYVRAELYLETPTRNNDWALKSPHIYMIIILIYGQNKTMDLINGQFFLVNLRISD